MPRNHSTKNEKFNRKYLVVAFAGNPFVSETAVYFRKRKIDKGLSNSR
ncbi:MAG: hypothetical protein LBR55_06775 [Bacteroidales bacterium]|nr:hypothetical protein [Bacteroidales bacterium]